MIKMFKLVENGGRGGEKEREEVREEGLEEEASSSQQSVPISVFQADMRDLQEKRQLEQRGPGRQHGTSLPLLSDGALQHLPLVGNTITWVLGAACEFGEHTGTQSVAATKFVGWPSDDPAGWSELPVICAVDRSPWEAIGHPASEQGSCLSVTILTAI